MRHRSPLLILAAALLPGFSGLPAPLGLSALPAFPGPSGLAGQETAPPASFDGDGDPVTAADYARAERLMGWNLSRIAYGMEPEPVFLDEGSRFWYRTLTPEGARFYLVDPAADERRPAFDHGRLAAAMSVAGDTAYRPDKLPFETLDFVGGDTRTVRVQASARVFTCDLTDHACRAGEVGDTAGPVPPGHVVSPDSAWEAFVHDHDLWVRAHPEGGDSIRLTDDGEALWAYGLTAPRPNQIRSGRRRTPDVAWSPDSGRLAVVRVDEREVETMPMYSSTAVRPEGYTYPYALPGDSIIPRPSLYVADVLERTVRRVELDHAPASLSLEGGADSLWTGDGSRLHFLTFQRGQKAVRLVEADAATGRSRVLVRDTTATFIDMNTRSGGPANWWVTGDGEVVWFSQRDGWGHLYRYDAGAGGAMASAGDPGDPGDPGAGAARPVGRITSGAWEVGDIVHVDESANQIYFTARGREEGRLPYYAHLYRAGLDGSGLTLLTPEDADHRVTLSPDGRWLVDAYSRIDEPPVTVLRDRSGRVVRELERADLSRVRELGWSAPELFTVKARDGVTDLYGLMYRPTDFDPSRRYPIISHIYPGPQVGSVRPWRFSVTRFHDDHAIADLGFIVVHLDHMGSPHRGKAFHDAYYGDMGDNGVPDHVAALKQLGARHDWIDLDRVGIYGGSGGAFASVSAMLTYPDFFKAAVARSGNHDNRTYGHYWGEKYHGLLERDTVRGTDNFERQANYLKAENLEGALLLAHGDLDDNVHPAMTIRLTDALIAANKDFEFFLMPDRAHGLYEPYFIRRSWDFWVRNLLGREPPDAYLFRRPEG